MKSDNFLRHVGLAFVIAIVGYAIFYAGIEYRRTKNGPWRVTFTNDVSGAPTLLVNEPKLAITNLQITFAGETNLSSTNASLMFDTPKQVPFDVPFGKCVFMDPTFLPGTIVFDLFGHEIQLIPRTLTIDEAEIPWRSGTTIMVAQATGTNSLQKAR